MEFNSEHYPVLYREVLEIVKDTTKDKVIDCTFGGGGHSSLILEMKPVEAIDCDKLAEKYANKIKNKDFKFHLGKFAQVIKTLDCENSLVFADLGTSVMQLNSNRGFSYSNNSTLSMTLSQSDIKLYKIINKLHYDQIQKILHKYQVKNANKVAKNIYNYMLHTDIKTSGQLREATKLDDYKSLSTIFQAFRIYINQELEQLESLINFLQEKNLDFIIISFHSMEADIIRRYRGYKYIREIKPTEQEILENPNSRSAILHYHSNTKI